MNDTIVITEDVYTVSVLEDSSIIVATEESIEVVSVGVQGPTGAQGLKGDQGDPGTPGAQGPAGAGFPTGGLTDQLLAKQSNTNYDTHWIYQAFEQTFSSQSSVTVTHNLGRYPSVTVFDSANDECFGEVQHLSINSLVVTFSAPFSGTIICN